MCQLLGVVVVASGMVLSIAQHSSQNRPTKQASPSKKAFDLNVFVGGLEGVPPFVCELNQKMMMTSKA